MPARGRSENATLPSGQVVDFSAGGVAIACVVESAAFVAAVVDDEASDEEGAIAKLLVADSNCCSALRLLVVDDFSFIRDTSSVVDCRCVGSSSCSS